MAANCGVASWLGKRPAQFDSSAEGSTNPKRSAQAEWRMFYRLPFCGSPPLASSSPKTCPTTASASVLKATCFTYVTDA